MYIYIHIYVYICIYICISIYTHMHIYIYYALIETLVALGPTAHTALKKQGPPLGAGGLLVPRGLCTDCIQVISGIGVNQILLIGLEGGMDVASVWRVIA